MTYWVKGFGNSNKTSIPQSLQDLCYPQDDNSSLPTIPLILDRKVFICSQIEEIKPKETYVIDVLNTDPKCSIHIIDFLTQERKFVKEIDFLLETILPSLVDAEYSRIERTLKEECLNLKQSHDTLLGSIENLIQNNPSDIVYKFIEIISSLTNLLDSNAKYMNRYFEVETQSLSFSSTYSQDYSSTLCGLPLIDLIRFPVQWQNWILEIISSLLQYLDSSYPPKYRTLLEDFSSQIIKLSDTIDSIPKLEQISHMFITEPFPIVVPGRRFVKQGTTIKHCRKNNTKREIVLFSDCFFYAQLKGGKYFIPQSYELTCLEAKPYPDPDRVTTMIIYTPKKSFVIDFETQKDRDEWLEAIKTAAANARANSESPPSDLRMAPIWIPDNEAPNCMICHTQFTMFLRRHHCRACGYVVCKNCLTHKVIMPGISETKQVPVCEACFLELSSNKKK
ncbi:pleckstrin domain-containing family F member 2 [Histomonas meleagridis]|uniref:pleckstrin-like domain-containing family F member 2 n=1 Tax=Histomonas meleagridis TaxID=135588 RepID=UPI00355ACAEA|nr:pleckstrin domain-containing family F member 2 [Histomonas meleagridis]KAH0798838.1 pleckstrin-like domain-containing family F member 2 [Histomonas meleagridis]